MARRRMMMTSAESSDFPFFSDYPVITEYGKYNFYSQSDESTITNTFIKMDDIEYTYCGGGAKSKNFSAVYTAEKLIIYQSPDASGTIWITKNQKSSSFALKRCAGTANAEPLVTLKVEKIS